MKFFKKLMIGAALVAAFFISTVANAQPEGKENYITWKFDQHAMEFFERAEYDGDAAIFYLEDERTDTHYYLTVMAIGGIITKLYASRQEVIDDKAAVMVMLEGVHLGPVVGTYVYDAHKYIVYEEPTCSLQFYSPNEIFDEVMDWFFGGEKRGA